MTPQAEFVFNYPMPVEESGMVRGIMAGAQFFDCSDLEPIIKARSEMPGDWSCIEEILECELPAQNTWIDFRQKFSIGLIRDLRGTYHRDGGAINLGGVYVEIYGGDLFILPFLLFQNGEVGALNPRGDKPNDFRFIEIAATAINTAWYCIEAMQTPGGLCHAVEHNPTRQQVRAASRNGKPCHKWIEIKLGRGQKRGAGDANSTGRTIAWHYRRGHRIEHPNPNYPKWRKGCWVGDTKAGIRTHNYVVEVPA